MANRRNRTSAEISSRGLPHPARRAGSTGGRFTRHGAIVVALASAWTAQAQPPTHGAPPESESMEAPREREPLERGAEATTPASTGPSIPRSTPEPTVGEGEQVGIGRSERGTDIAPESFESRLEALRARARQIEGRFGAAAAEDALGHARRALRAAQSSERSGSTDAAERALDIADAALILADRLAARREARRDLRAARAARQRAHVRARAAREALERVQRERARVLSRANEVEAESGVDPGLNDPNDPGSEEEEEE